MVQITPEQLEALAQSEDHCLRITDPKTNKRYVLFEDPTAPEADEAHIEYMRRGLELAEEQVAAGKVVPWDPEAILREGRERLRRRS